MRTSLGKPLQVIVSSFCLTYSCRFLEVVHCTEDFVSLLLSRAIFARVSINDLVSDVLAFLFSGTPHPGMPQVVLKKTEEAIADSDIVLFMVDARQGVTEADRHYAR